jgi:predicted metal-binding membrane protein
MDSTRPSPGAAPDAALSPQPSPTFLESALRVNRTPVLLLLVFVPAASWLWIVVMARDMYGPMTGASAWMMSPAWDVPHLLLLSAMWTVMMIAMMVPSAAPLVLLYGAAARRTAPQPAALRIYALAAGYVVVWALFSIAATALQRLLSSLLLLSPMMEASNGRVSGTLLLLAGMYQLTPAKHACLRACQSPLGFLMSRWRDGIAGAFRMGTAHGVYCVGCCWALMLLLFAGGVMNLTVIAALTALVAAEKLLPIGRRGIVVSGVLLATAGLWVLLR